MLVKDFSTQKKNYICSRVKIFFEPCYEFQKADLKETVEVFGLINELADYENEPNLNPYENFKQAFKSPNLSCLIAKHKGKVVAYSTYYSKRI